MKFALAILALTSVEALKMKIKSQIRQDGTGAAGTAAATTMPAEEQKMEESYEASYDSAASYESTNTDANYYSSSWGDWEYSGYYDPATGQSSSWSSNSKDGSWSWNDSTYTNHPDGSSDWSYNDAGWNAPYDQGFDSNNAAGTAGTP